MNINLPEEPITIEFDPGIEAGLWEQSIPIEYDPAIEDTAPQRVVTLMEEAAFGDVSIISSFNPSTSELSLAAWGSILVHLLVFICALMIPRFIPPPVCPMPFMTVSLVSLGDVRGGSTGTESPGRGSGCEVAEDSEPSVSPPVVETPAPLFEQAEAPEEPPEPEPEEPKPVVALVQKEVAPPPKKVEQAPQKKERHIKQAVKPKQSSKPTSPQVNASSASTDATASDKPVEGPGAGSNGSPGSGSGKLGLAAEGEHSGGIAGSSRTEFQLAQVEKPPAITHKVEPDYPYSARRLNLSGKVLVKFLVDTQGRVQKPCVLQADPKGVFEECVLDALKKWRFKPGYLKGQPVSTWVVLPIQFKLSG